MPPLAVTRKRLGRELPVMPVERKDPDPSIDEKALDEFLTFAAKSSESDHLSLEQSRSPNCNGARCLNGHFQPFPRILSEKDGNHC